MRVQLFATCLGDLVFPEAVEDAERLLRAAGHQVEFPRRQVCCGQPAFNAGYVDDARRVARTTHRALAKTDGPIVVPSGSCAAMMTHYWPELLGDSNVSERVVEFSAYFSRSGGHTSVSDRGMSSRVAYHDSCHMLRVLGIKNEPRALLGGDEHVAELSERCCGFGGTFSVKLPEVSTAMADEKLDEVVATGCTTLVGCDLSCLMHLGGRAGRRGLDLDVRHLAEVLDG
jgi:L-lactate dehydrogenase complex protein LldE